MALRPVAFLSDFGHQDPFVGICHAVILRVDAGVRIIDLSHGIARHDVRAGAVALADAVPFLPDDAVVIGVVDPGVGSERRAIAVESVDGMVFVGPDNGLLAAAIELRGGAKAAFEISNSPWRLEPVSATFHGRDLFAPVAARIAAGAPIVECGVAIGHDDLEQLDLPHATTIDGDLTTAVLAVDQYGNARLAATPQDLGPIEPGDIIEIDTDDMRRQAHYGSTYADSENGGPLLIVDSTGALSVSINGGDAAVHAAPGAGQSREDPARMSGTLGHPHIHLDVVDSTNALAKEKAIGGAVHGTVFTAHEQTAGRGRQGRSWVAPAGSALLMSVILRPAEEHHRFAPLAAAVAVAETCERLAGVRAQIKWPNDVWIDKRKVSGILVEGRPDPDPEKSWVVIGIGLNTRVRLEEMPEELQQTAASLALDEHTDALAPLLERLEYWLDAPTKELIAAWSARDALRGRDVAWDDGEGVATGIDEEGGLIVRRCGGGISVLGAGEVHLKLT